MKPRKIIRTPDRLLKYAGWYALRYMPSVAKLRDALMKKSENNAELVEPIMVQMEGYIAEDRTIESLVHLWLEQGKIERYVRTKLRERQFAPETIDRILDEHSPSFWDFSIYRTRVVARIASLRARSKSREFIRLTLEREYPWFREEIAELLWSDTMDDTELLAREIEKFFISLDLSDPKSRDKLIRRFLSRGFRYDEVRKCLRDYEKII